MDIIQANGIERAGLSALDACGTLSAVWEETHADYGQGIGLVGTGLLYDTHIDDD